MENEWLIPYGWRPLPHLELEYSFPSTETEEELKLAFRGLVFRIQTSSLLALGDTWGASVYKEFILLWTFKVIGENSFLVGIITNEADFVSNFQKRIQYQKENEESFWKEWSAFNEKYYNIDARLPIAEHLPLKVVFDPRLSRIEYRILERNPCQVLTDKTTDLLLRIGGMKDSSPNVVDCNKIKCDGGKRFLCYVMDNQSIDMSRIIIRVDNPEEYDFIYQELDAEIEEWKRFDEKIKKEIGGEFDSHLIGKSGDILFVPENEDDFRGIMRNIMNEIKNYIENKQGYRLLWNDDGTPRKETLVHIYFDNLLENLCNRKNIDMSREPFMGRGPVDFKFSATSSFRACLELKLSSNKRIYHGLAKQLPSYMLPQKVRIGIFVIIILDERDKERIDKLLKEKNELEERHGISIDIISIDATSKKVSASKIDRVPNT